MPNRVITNRLGLPASIVAAVANDPYTRGESDISVTGLISPAYQRRLMETVPEVVEDVADRIWALIGQIGHSIVERAHDGTGLVEERLFMPVNGWIVSGQFDLIDTETRTLYDFKFTTVWSANGKPEWEQQLNLLRVLAHHRYAETGDERYAVERLAIIAIFRDWQKSKAMSADYPDTQVKVIPVPVWAIERATEFMRERVLAHQDPSPPPCTDEERWAKPGSWAVMKRGLKRALKLHDNPIDAKAHAESVGDGASVEVRPPSYTRCERYCSVVNACPVFNDTPF